jgi:hypothetical protein
MESKRGIYSRILIAATWICIVISCVAEVSEVQNTDVEIILKGQKFTIKAALPEEEKISNASLMIFDSNGLLEKDLYLGEGQSSCVMNLLRGQKYSIYACINFGYPVKVSRIEDLDEITFFMTYPDEYQEGIPMTASVHDIMINGDDVIELELERLMAKIDIRMDRSRLSDGVRMDVTGVKIGNCPKKMTPFSINRVENEDECFTVGFRHGDLECSELNRLDYYGTSRPVSLYMFENMQGKFSEHGIYSPQEKVFDENDPRKDICSYIELEMDYSYEDMASKDQPLIYRFYLGENLNSLDIERNSQYTITVSPEDDGLKEDSWRVDKSGIRFTGKPELVQYPGDYLRGNIGDVIHIGCRLTPSWAPFDIGLEYLEADKAEGIYDYIIDEDGRGVTLTLKGPGTGLIYMEAGDPINDAALFFIEVNL